MMGGTVSGIIIASISRLYRFFLPLLYTFFNALALTAPFVFLYICVMVL
jgi:hypothetical protein